MAGEEDRGEDRLAVLDPIFTSLGRSGWWEHAEREHGGNMGKGFKNISATLSPELSLCLWRPHKLPSLSSGLDIHPSILMKGEGQKECQ